MNVVVVESPAKAKTINSYLGKDFTVLASFGHVRDLPAKDGSVKPDNDFEMLWEADAKSAKRLKDISDALKGADRLILATDPDREGEAISWHVLETLNKKRALKGVSVERVVFNAITKSAVSEAMSHPRQVDMELVEAYLARRALDYLVGFNLSPVLWRKLPGARSAGRVQSVALRLVCEREQEIEAFTAREYWSVKTGLTTPRGAGFDARLVSLDGNKLDKFDLANEADAARAVAAIEAREFSVTGVQAKPVMRNPSPPFMTSTLQQEASRKLGFGASQTMRAAQKLYEAGHITYMRTDGLDMAGEAIGALRAKIQDRFGTAFLPKSPRIYKTKAKNAQEAHECIRPTDFGRASVNIGADEARLYDLIYKRTVASQMEAARLERTTVEIESPDAKVGLRATGQIVKFEGFLAVYEEGRDDNADDDEARLLPDMAQGDALTRTHVTPEQHFTQPPPRFTEASLVKRMEELGIGRPSTYASILSVLQDREYVRLEKKRFIPEDKGRLVTAFLEGYFKRYVEYDFTADLEEKLDKVSAGDLPYKALLREFWDAFKASIEETGDLRVSDVLDTLDASLGQHVFRPGEDGRDPRACPTCGTGRLNLKLGRYGAFVGCSNYPECKFTRPFAQSGGENGGQENGNEDKTLGIDPETGQEVFLKSGRFGPYVQLGEGDKPKRSSLPKGWAASELGLDRALKLLSLPREVGPHPEDGEMILANLGRFGPYVQHLKTYANVSSIDDVFEIGLNRAVSLIAEKRTKGPRRGAEALRVLGEHPESGNPVEVFAGKYGPYVKCDGVNATLPKEIAPEAVTLAQALELIAAKGPAKVKKGAAKKPAAKKPAAKKAAAKKPAAKKPAAKKPAAKKTAPKG